VGREQAKGDTPVATTTPGDGTAPAAGAVAPQKPQLQQKKPVQPAQSRPPFGNFFGFGNPAPAPAPRQLAPAPPRSPIAPGVPRPPAPIGRSAEVPGNPTR
jgi:hypothetical protein